MATTMSVRIAKRFTFDAAHWLPFVPDGHKCGRKHGHTYTAEIICGGPVGQDGMVIDYAVIADKWRTLHEQLDHRMLNEVRGLENPTTEVLAPWIFERLKASGLPVVQVRVYESSTTWCETEEIAL
jgi:6-pyruvoyltetrahydropterin/6-carboxytetrahydropterin synthase